MHLCRRCKEHQRKLLIQYVTACKHRVPGFGGLVSAPPPMSQWAAAEQLVAAMSEASDHGEDSDHPQVVQAAERQAVGVLYHSPDATHRGLPQVRGTGGSPR